MSGPSRRLAPMIDRLRGDVRGAVALMFAILAPVLIITAFGVIDISSIYEAKTHLQDSTDAAALAVSAADSANPNTTEAALKTIASNLLAADFASGTASIASFTVCTPVQTTDCASAPGGEPLVTNTVNITTNVRASCWAPVMLPGVCTNGSQSMLLTAQNSTNIGFAANIQINMLLDTSGSMIVGATSSDVQSIETWTAANWSQVNYAADKNQGVQCAFACHDEGPGNGSNQPTTYGASGSDMQLGLTNAHLANATTRYDVMVTAASNLISHVQTEVSQSPTLSKNSYYFNLYSLADNIAKQYTAQTANDYSDAKTALGGLYVGLDTHFNENAAAFASAVGTNGTGNSATSPLKFVIVVTDGVESDFYKDFYTCSGESYDSKWGSYIGTGCFATPFSTAQCTAMKNQGIVLAVLETPYVPLTGQDPKETLYEGFVRSMIYPGGPSTASTVSTNLQSCATSGYYFQANTPSDISAGFVDLTDKFLASSAYIKN